MTFKQNIHVDTALTNYSQKSFLQNEGYVADMVAPRLKVSKASNEYFIYDAETALKIQAGVRARAGRAPESTYTLSTDSYLARIIAAEDKIAREDQRDADAAVNLRIDTTDYLMDQIRRFREDEVATLMTDTTSYAATNSVTLSGVTQWDNGSFAGSIKQDIRDGMEVIRQTSGGVKPNMIVIPSEVASFLAGNDEILDLVKYTHESLLVDGFLPPMLFGMKVVVPGSTKNTANILQTASYADIWGKNVIMLHVPPAVGLKTACFVKTFEAKTIQVMTWFDPFTNADWLRAEEETDIKVTGNTLGYLIKDCIS